MGQVMTGAAETHETNGIDHQGRTATAHPICAAAGEQPLHLIENFKVATSTLKPPMLRKKNSRYLCTYEYALVRQCGWFHSCRCSTSSSHLVCRIPSDASSPHGITDLALVKTGFSECNNMWTTSEVSRSGAEAHSSSSGCLPPVNTAAARALMACAQIYSCVKLCGVCRDLGRTEWGQAQPTMHAACKWLTSTRP